MSITIKEIAEIAGISRAAVDKVIHERPGISDEVRIKVKKIIHEYNYVPNPAARALKAYCCPLKIAVIIPETEHPMFHRLKMGMEAKAETLKVYGISLEFYYSDGLNTRDLTKIFNTIEQNEVHGIALRFKDNKTARQIIDRYSDKGIPVVTFDTDIPDTKRLCFVGEDHRQIGKLAASLLAKCNGGSGKVAIFHGSHEIVGHRLRAEGFRKKISESYPDISIVAQVETNEQRDITFEKTKKLLAKHPDLRGIFVAGRALNIAEATADSKHKVNIVICDYVQEATQLIKDELIDFAIGLTPYQEGEIVIETLFRVLYHKKKLKKSFIKTPTSIYVSENIDEYVDKKY